MKPHTPHTPLIKAELSPDPITVRSQPLPILGYRQDKSNINFCLVVLVLVRELDLTLVSRLFVYLSNNPPRRHA